MFTMGEDMMKQWAANWEKMMGSQLEKMVHNEKFVGEMAKAIGATMSGKALYSKAVEEQMAALNLPTRTDVVKILQKLTDVEERLIDLSERFEDFVEEQTPRMQAMEKLLAAMKGTTEKKSPATKATPAKKPPAKKATSKK